MRLRNKQTGEIIEKFPDDFVLNSGEQIRSYKSLAELNSEWEDYEEPKEYWYIEADGSILQNHKPTYINHLLDGLKSIGNYFETKEEAEFAVRKLKAWKRLKDKGFRFETFGYDRETVKNGRVNIMVRATFDEKYGDDSVKLSDLDLLFGGEE